ncbi:MAG TPA: hypothetical protein VGC69_08235 [Bordetella sp.]
MPSLIPLPVPLTSDQSVSAELVAVLVAVSSGEPRVLALHGGTMLPAGPFEVGHLSLQGGLRAWVEAQTRHPLGYVEQLYTFSDRDRAAETGVRTISISYLGLTRERQVEAAVPGAWQAWYSYFPWEDRRGSAAPLVDDLVLPRLQAWARRAANAAAQAQRMQRVHMTFGSGGHAWSEDMVLQRYELLFEAGLVAEATRQGRAAHEAGLLPGAAMRYDHRRILATAMARLRAKIKYRPVVFELMPLEFTLSQLQSTVEALAGRGLHKQNFRRLVEQQSLVEETGAIVAGVAGRPAKLYRFRSDVMLERAISGSKLPLARED